MSLFNTIIIAIAIVAFGSATDTIDSADVGLNANLILADSVTTPSVCNKGCVDCRNGNEVIDGAITKRSCYDACGGSVGSCCVDGNGYDACVNFSGLVCKDGSCSNGANACKGASIELVINSCIGAAACMNAGSNGGSVGDVVDSCHGYGACFTAAWKGSIDTIENSCRGFYACEYAAWKGSIDTIENSCNYGDYNCYQLASYEGSIGHILSSCSGTVNARVNKACAGVGREEPTGDILSCCNGEYKVCCQNSRFCGGNTVTTLPEACASDPTVGIRGFARRFADE